MLVAGLLLIMLAGLLPAVPPLWPGSAWAYWAGCLSPTEPFYYAHAANFWHHGNEFWSSLAVSHLAGWLFVGLASWRLARFVEAAPASSNANAWQRFLAGNAGFGKKQRRTPLLEINPVLWLLEDSPWLGWMIWGLCAGEFLDGWHHAGVRRGRRHVPANLHAPFYFSLKNVFAIQACRFFSEARRNGTLELLGVTPLSSQTIIRRPVAGVAADVSVAGDGPDVGGAFMLVVILATHLP